MAVNPDGSDAGIRSNNKIGNGKSRFDQVNFYDCEHWQLGFLTGTALNVGMEESKVLSSSLYK